MSKYGHGTNDFLEIIYENSDKILSGGYGILGIFSIILLQTGINNNLLKKENKIISYPSIGMISICFGYIPVSINFLYKENYFQLDLFKIALFVISYSTIIYSIILLRTKEVNTVE